MRPLRRSAASLIGLPLAWAVYRSRAPRVRALVRLLTQLPVALPALVLAFGFVLVFSSDTLPWLGSRGLLIAGHLIVCLPYFLHTVLSDMRRLGLDTLEDAAESLGSQSAGSASSSSCCRPCVIRCSRA